MAKRGEARRFLETSLGEETNECLPWPFAKNSWGYGIVRIEGRTVRASRVVCEKAYGPPPAPDMDAAHYCGNAACINRRHLRWATKSENCLDKLKHGTMPDFRGERNPSSKLTEENTDAIRRMLASGSTQVEIATQFGVSQSQVSLIKLGKKWAIKAPVAV